jgi:hypothetical protein
MPVTQANELLAGKLKRLRAIINQHKVISRAVHLGEFQYHRQERSAAPSG